MKIGTTDIKDMFLGTIEVKKIFSGTTLLYEKISTPILPARYIQTTTADFNARWRLYWNRRIYYITSRQAKWL